ncbi:MAG TPA: A/G-specific adenine glycosylase [Oligoflexia bacterium]|nr:A/G-specific adenine glycosylase [Oligoflexia bacterium]
MLQIDRKSIASLVEWFRKNQRDLPWRRDPHPYKVWVAEVMSQQTQMNTLLPYFHRFMERFPSVGHLAQSSIEEVFVAWTGLGYYSRARNLHRAAKTVTEDLKGRFPTSFGDWLELSGVGPYTAAAVTSQCFDSPHAVWDGNVLRVASRFFAESQAYSQGFKTAVSRALEKHMSRVPSSQLNQAVMELGALVCTPVKPDCDNCPLRRKCRAFADKNVQLYPPAKIKRREHVVHAVVSVHLKKTADDCFVLLKKRDSGLWYSGMWDFPTELGGVQNPQITLLRLKDKKNDLGTIALKPIKHSITHHRISLLPRVKVEVGLNQPTEDSEVKWFNVEQAFGDRPQIPVATTARKVMRAVSRWLDQVKEKEN